MKMVTSFIKLALFVLSTCMSVFSRIFAANTPVMIFSMLILTVECLASSSIRRCLGLGAKINYPIEQYYRHVNVSPSYIPHGSKAFILWRQNTPPWIPDSAFNYHYYEDTILLAMMGKMETKDTGTLPENGNIWSIHPGASIMESPSTLFPKGSGPRGIVNSRFSTPEKMFAQLEIDPRLTRKKLDQWYRLAKTNSSDALRFFVDEKGTIFALLPEETKKIGEAIGQDINFHDSTADIVLGERRLMLAGGTIYYFGRDMENEVRIGAQSAIDILEYFTRVYGAPFIFTDNNNPDRI